MIDGWRGRPRDREVMRGVLAILQELERTGNPRPGDLARGGARADLRRIRRGPQGELPGARPRSCTQMSAEEDGHRHRLIELHRAKFGEHIPLIRRQDVKGFVRAQADLDGPAAGSGGGPQADRADGAGDAAVLRGGRPAATDAGIRQLLGDLAAEERKHSNLAEELEGARPPPAPMKRRRPPSAGCTFSRSSSRAWPA